MRLTDGDRQVEIEAKQSGPAQDSNLERRAFLNTDEVPGPTPAEEHST